MLSLITFLVLLHVNVSRMLFSDSIIINIFSTVVLLGTSSILPSRVCTVGAGISHIQ